MVRPIGFFAAQVPSFTPPNVPLPSGDGTNVNDRIKPQVVGRLSNWPYDPNPGKLPAGSVYLTNSGQVTGRGADCSGYYGVAAVDDNLKIVSICHRGSASVKDFVNGAPMVVGLPSAYQTDADAFREYVGNLSIVKDKGYKIVHFGHSQGGNLSLSSGYRFGDTAYAVDPVGNKSMMKSQFGVLDANKINLLNIFLSEPDSVNLLGEHLAGNIYRVKLTGDQRALLDRKYRNDDVRERIIASNSLYPATEDVLDSQPSYPILPHKMDFIEKAMAEGSFFREEKPSPFVPALPIPPFTTFDGQSTDNSGQSDSRPNKKACRDKVANRSPAANLPMPSQNLQSNAFQPPSTIGSGVTGPKAKTGGDKKNIIADTKLFVEEQLKNQDPSFYNIKPLPKAPNALSMANRLLERGQISFDGRSVSYSNSVPVGGSGSFGVNVNIITEPPRRKPPNTDEAVIPLLKEIARRGGAILVKPSLEYENLKWSIDEFTVANPDDPSKSEKIFALRAKISGDMFNHCKNYVFIVGTTPGLDGFLRSNEKWNEEQGLEFSGKNSIGNWEKFCSESIAAPWTNYQNALMRKRVTDEVNAAFACGDWSKTVACTKEYLQKIDPNSILARKKQAFAYDNLGETDEALKIIDPLIESGKIDNVDDILWAAEKHSLRSDAVTDSLFEKAVGLSKSDGQRNEIKVKQAEYLFDNGNWKKAKELTVGIEILSSYQLQYRIAKNSKNSGDVYKFAQKVDENGGATFEVVSDLVFADLKEGDVGDKERLVRHSGHCKGFLSLIPEGSEQASSNEDTRRVRRHLAVVSSELHDNDELNHLYPALLRDDPDFFLTLRMKAGKDVEAGNDGAAIESLEKLTTKCPERNGDDFKTLVGLYRKGSKGDEAARVLNYYTHLYPDDEEMRRECIKESVDAGLWTQADSHLQILNTRSSSDPQVAEWKNKINGKLGVIAALAGNGDGAFERAQQLSDDDPQKHRIEAILLRKGINKAAPGRRAVKGFDRKKKEIEHLKRVIQLDPEGALEESLRLAKIYEEQKKPLLAARYYDSAGRACKDPVKAASYHMKSAGFFKDAKDTGSEKKQLAESVLRDPNEWRAHLRLSDIYRNEGCRGDAIEELKPIINQAAADAKMRTNTQKSLAMVAEAKMGLLLIDEGEQLEREAGSEEGRAAGAALQENGVALVTGYLKSRPNAKNYNQELGDHFHRKKDLDKARDFWSKEASIDAGNYKVRIKLADDANDRKDIDVEIRWTREAKAIRGAPVGDLTLRLGSLYADKGEHQKATEEYEEFLAGDPDNEKALLDSGASYFRLNQKAQADEKFRRALELNPQSGTANTGLAAIHFQNGDDIIGASLYEKSKECKSQHGSSGEILRLEQEVEREYKETRASVIVVSAAMECCNAGAANVGVTAISSLRTMDNVSLIDNLVTSRFCRVVPPTVEETRSMAGVAQRIAMNSLFKLDRDERIFQGHINKRRRRL